MFGEDKTLYEWAASVETRSEFRGRGRVYSVPAPVLGPSGAKHWAVRHYFRGGAMAMHMVDRYLRLGHPRPWRELAASEAARSRGVRTPAVVAAAVYLDGACYRADLVTEVVSNARTLATTLFEQDGTRGWAVAMSRAGALIRTLSDSGVFHIDLNAHNILLPDDPNEDALVVDLDRARILRRSSDSASERMRARLTRSIVKVGTPTGEHLRDSEIRTALARRVSGS
ncbi:MAG: hypothetical protein O2958_00625 [Gemmatimonadetes bacterium]|nr:hypothetical protein [Gemmatimonadota bacterium]MDA1102697.1 hypothetical protein [Gemmatimonadota bacterium]